jgi:hypothetical protein
MVDEGRVTADARIMLVFTGSGLKNPPPSLPDPVDLAGDEAEVFDRVQRLLRA